ncbi:MAG: 2-oxoglutarate ferredoxin oxidoreductase subunit alpha, partial [Bermanella sp.]
EDFIEQHDTVFVVEQNRDAQLRSLLVNECEVPPKQLLSVLNYNGTPITARQIREKIASVSRGDNVRPLHKKTGSKE